MPHLLVSAIRCWLAIRSQGLDWLFPSGAGTPYHDRNLLRRKVWPVCDRLGIARFGWHTLRHTFSTFGGNSGVPLPVMQSLLGHTSAETTMLYMHPLAEPQREAVEKLARILFPNVPILEHSRRAKVG
jgi:integrase